MHPITATCLLRMWWTTRDFKPCQILGISLKKHRADSFLDVGFFFKLKYSHFIQRENKLPATPVPGAFTYPFNPETWQQIQSKKVCQISQMLKAKEFFSLVFSSASSIFMGYLVKHHHLGYIWYRISVKTKFPKENIQSS